MNKTRILVIEDDREINELVSHYLKKEDYLVDSVFDGREALEYISSNSYQMIILDLMIPYVDGYEVLRKIRNKGNIPVLIISAKASESDKIIGLGLGADDYIAKPFGMGELIARVKAQLRRYMSFTNVASENCILKHLDIELDLNACTIKINKKNVSLTAKDYEILKLFMSNPKRVFTKSQIFSAVWKQNYLSDENTLMVHIRRLREKIEVEPSKPRYIQTVWGIGYKLGEV